jgi:hypothetical protein
LTGQASKPSGSDRDPVVIDTSVAHSSRIYDYLLGGTDNFAVDREVAEHAFSAYPGGTDGARSDARANRAFLGRAVRFLADEGIRQFLDIGTGIPSADNTHAVAQQAAPTSRIVYVDNDPIVLAHAHTLMRGFDTGTTDYIDGDLVDPEGILEKAARTLDLGQPVGLMLVGILHVIPDAADPHGLVARLTKRLASGSFLVLTHMASDILPEQMATVLDRLDERMHNSNPPAFRDRAEVEQFFVGLELVEPGVVHLDDWRPDDGRDVPAGRLPPLYCGVARKP